MAVSLCFHGTGCLFFFLFPLAKVPSMGSLLAKEIGHTKATKIGGKGIILGEISWHTPSKNMFLEKTTPLVSTATFIANLKLPWFPFFGKQRNHSNKLFGRVLSNHVSKKIIGEKSVQTKDTTPLRAFHIFPSKHLSLPSSAAAQSDAFQKPIMATMKSGETLSCLAHSCW